MDFDNSKLRQNLDDPRPLPTRYKRPNLRPQRSFVSFSDEVTIISHPEENKPPEVRIMSDNRVINPVGFEKNTNRPAVHHVEDSYHDEDFDMRFKRYLRRIWHRRTNADPLVVLLALLCSTPIYFTLGVVAWALRNPEDLCRKAPALADYFNGLAPALASVLPALIITTMLVLLHKPILPTSGSSPQPWTKKSSLLLVFLLCWVAIFVMAWASLLRKVTHQVSCTAVDHRNQVGPNWGPDLTSQTWEEHRRR